MCTGLSGAQGAEKAEGLAAGDEGVPCQTCEKVASAASAEWIAESRDCVGPQTYTLSSPPLLLPCIKSREPSKWCQVASQGTAWKD